MKAIIMAGGKGTRLQSISQDIPKPMVRVWNKPILEYQIESLKNSGITEIVLIVGHLRKVIQDYFGNGNKYGVHIEYVIEDKPLGTAGALYYLKGSVTEDFILVFGDLMLDIDFSRFMNFHKKHGAFITLYGHPNSHPYDSDVIVVNNNNRVTEILSKKEPRSFNYHNFVNAGIYCIKPQVIDSIEQAEKLDLEKDIIAKEVKNGTVFAYKSTEYVKDMGTPDRLTAVSLDVQNGVVSGRNLKRKQKAVFLDRDGTINEHVGFLSHPEQFQLIQGAAEAIRMINESEFLSIVITNQPVVARGECSFETLEEIHKKMETELGKNGAYLDDLYFCPHHPDKGFIGEIPELKIECECRKPKTGMIDKAVDMYNIDASLSWFVGDSTIDIKTGKNAGLKTILVRTGESGKDGKYDVEPDYTADNLLDAVKYIISG